MSEFPTSTHARSYAVLSRQRSDGEEQLARLRKLVQQHPLIETRPSQLALRDICHPPRGLDSVFIGIGLASGPHLSASLPLDALGMLLMGEQVRQVVGARELVVLVADTHARSNGIPTLDVLKKADEYAELLSRVQRRIGLHQMRIMLASDIHCQPDFQDIYLEIKRRAPLQDHDYFKREVADIEYFHRRSGGVVKVGWTMDRGGQGVTKRDERAFDRRFCRWVGRHVPFVYCKAGRVFDDQRRKASPYLTLDPQRRLCLNPDEDVRGKVQCARREVSVSTFRGVGRHLSAVTRTYGQVVAPVRGPLEQRVELMLQNLFPHSTIC